LKKAKTGKGGGGKGPPERLCKNKYDSSKKEQGGVDIAKMGAYYEIEEAGSKAEWTDEMEGERGGVRVEERIWSERTTR